MTFRLLQVNYAHRSISTRRRTRRSSVVTREGVCPADWRCQQLCIERTMLCSLEQSAVMPRTISRRCKISHQISDHAGRSVVTPWKRTVPSRLGGSAIVTWISGPFSWYFKLFHVHCKNMWHPTCDVYAKANNFLSKLSLKWYQRFMLEKLPPKLVVLLWKICIA